MSRRGRVIDCTDCTCIKSVKGHRQQPLELARDVADGLKIHQTHGSADLLPNAEICAQTGSSRSLVACHILAMAWDFSSVWTVA